MRKYLSLSWILSLFFGKDIKYFIELHYKRDRDISDCSKRIAFSIGLCFNWEDFNINCCNSEYYIPKGEKKGTHKLTITIGIAYYYISIVFYKIKL